MPAENKPRLKDHQKISILAKKMIGTETINTIARQEGVSEPTVSRIKPETVSPDILAKAQAKAESLLERIERVRDKALTRLEEKLDADALDGKTLNTTFGVTYDKSRLEKGLATEITQTARPPIEIALEYADKYLRYLETQGIAGDDAMALLGEKLADNEVLERVGVNRSVREEAILRLSEKRA